MHEHGGQLELLSESGPRHHRRGSFFRWLERRVRLLGSGDEPVRMENFRTAKKKSTPSVSELKDNLPHAPGSGGRDGTHATASAAISRASTTSTWRRILPTAMNRAGEAQQVDRAPDGSCGSCGGTEGSRIAGGVRKSLTHPPVCVLMTAYGSEKVAVQAMKRGALRLHHQAA